MDLKLEEIGLTKGEIKIYLALAKHGSLSKSELSVKAEISSSKVYETVEKLVKKGLVGQIKKNGKTIYQVNDPNRLLDFIEEREKKIALEKDIVKRAIPIINNLKNKNKDYRFEILEGNEGIKQSLNELMSEIKDNEEICGLGIEMKNIIINKTTAVKADPDIPNTPPTFVTTGSGLSIPVIDGGRIVVIICDNTIPIITHIG